ncbi:MAG: DUF177 domain-containing protein [Actinobacteria bacterium]|nr:DUF177 domain-containing protein [Actinomycetota bacterium]
MCVVIDPTAPWVLDVHDFRRAGEFKRVHRVVPAPAGIANPVIEVPPGADMKLDLTLESVIDGVLVTADLTFPTVGFCSRCLEPLAETLDSPFSELYLWVEPEQVDPDDDPLPLVQGGLIDLSGAIRDAVVLALPLAPVCGADCGGLCPTCGIKLADNPGHDHVQDDPRWAALKALQLPPDVGEDSTMGDT